VVGIVSSSLDSRVANSTMRYSSRTEVVGANPGGVGAAGVGGWGVASARE
jgi:hypothetical protein